MTPFIVTAPDEFQPALPMRGVTAPSEPQSTVFEFQPALAMRGVTNDPVLWWAMGMDFNPHSPCGE